ncbi:MAG: thiosulfate sulfurtransferase GlpE [Candidatus Nitrohelix vancouverensis]|uniref:Thiosulfate sulfurtransferase GlpE n=1 Tax=Candidatus Nitrohelix vancouverensis TaxID=2705534 RepID=A0A7T0C118_9BACT|nr:MAG: thiosulfate sulfurtransferase GlpE [Candidatus Nitrohelix vancouverensis]
MPELKQIDVNKAKELMDAGPVNVVDIRDPGSYQAGHIPSAVNLSDANVADYIEKTDKDKPLIVCCYHGNSSQGASMYLSEQGFKESYSLMGGFEVWQSAFPEEQESGYDD